MRSHPCPGLYMRRLGCQGLAGRLSINIPGPYRHSYQVGLPCPADKSRTSALPLATYNQQLQPQVLNIVCIVARGAEPKDILKRFGGGGGCASGAVWGPNTPHQKVLVLALPFLRKFPYCFWAIVN